MKVIRFETTYLRTLAGSKHPANAKYLGFIEIPAPDNYLSMTQYELTAYAESITGMMAIGYLAVITR